MKKLPTLVLLLIAAQFSFAQTIQVSTANAYCAGYNVQLSYTASGTFNNDNVFTAQLSDSSGSFVKPVTIGTATSTSSGIIVTTIPANTKSGYHYLIRVVSSDPVASSNPNILTDNIHITGNETTVSNDTSICSGMYVQLHVSGGFSYSWSPGNSLNDSSSANPYAAPTVTTTYIVVISPNNSCGPVADTAVISVGNAAVGGTLTASQDTICQGNTATLFLQGNSPDAIQWQSSMDHITFSVIPGASNSTYTTSALGQSTFYRALIGQGTCSAQSDTLEIYVPPALLASFYSTENNQSVSFNSDSSLGNIRSYSWSFGDGSHSNQQNPTHNYKSAGIYNVCLIINGGTCNDTFCKAVVAGNITSCDAFFTLVPDTTTPHHWYAINYSVGKNPISYNWSWGDGSNATGDTASHTYASAGYYTICLTINDDTLCSSTYCDSSVYLYRMDESQAIVKINVVNSSLTGINNITPSKNQLAIHPNPCVNCTVTGAYNSVDLEITDLLGRKVNAIFTNEGSGFNLSLPNQLTGIYFIRDNRTGQVVKFVKE